MRLKKFEVRIFRIERKALRFVIDASSMRGARQLARTAAVLRNSPCRRTMTEVVKIRRAA